MQTTPTSSTGRKRWWIAGITVLAAAVTLPLFSSQVLADDDHEERSSQRSERRESERRPSANSVRVGMPKAYQSECASCHMAYEPRFLPAASWQRMMNTLDKHYGTDASIDAATAKTISTWLQANAGSSNRLGSTPPEDRITRTRWFLHEHDEIPASTLKRPKIGSAANCMACHTGADKGNYDEDSVRIPR
jgi:mono/diheme cytochrome c family protein